MKNSAVYPGEYRVLPETELFLKSTMSRLPKTTFAPAISISQDKYAYKVEILIPGRRREDIFLKVRQRNLSLVAKGRIPSTDRGKRTALKSVQAAVISHNIPLPADADPEFMCAEFKEGVLRIHIPKNAAAGVITDMQIVVY